MVAIEVQTEMLANVNYSLVTEKKWEKEENSCIMV